MYLIMVFYLKTQTWHSHGEIRSIFHLGCLPFWLSFTSVVLHFGNLPLWSFSILAFFHLGRVPFYVDLNFLAVLYSHFYWPPKYWNYLLVRLRHLLYVMFALNIVIRSQQSLFLFSGILPFQFHVLLLI